MSNPKEVKAQTLKFTLMSKNVLSADESELYELCQLAGVVLDPKVFKIIHDLLKLNIAPLAIMQMLKTMRSQKQRKGSPEEAARVQVPSGHSTGRQRDPTGTRPRGGQK